MARRSWPQAFRALIRAAIDGTQPMSMSNVNNAGAKSLAEAHQGFPFLAGSDLRGNRYGSFPDDRLGAKKGSVRRTILPAADRGVDESSGNGDSDKGLLWSLSEPGTFGVLRDTDAANMSQLPACWRMWLRGMRDIDDVPTHEEEQAEIDAAQRLRIRVAQLDAEDEKLRLQEQGSRNRAGRNSSGNGSTLEHAFGRTSNDQAQAAWGHLAGASAALEQGGVGTTSSESSNDPSNRFARLEAGSGEQHNHDQDSDDEQLFGAQQPSQPALLATGRWKGQREDTHGDFESFDVSAFGQALEDDPSQRRQ